jgi:hypothetical protein
MFTFGGAVSKVAKAEDADQQGSHHEIEESVIGIVCHVASLRD